MRLLWIMLGVVACSGSSEDSAVESLCDGSTGEIWGEIVDLDGSLHGGSTVVYVTPEGEDGYALAATSEGSYAVTVAPGRYRISAESDWGCFADPEPEVDVEACEEVQADLLMDLCFGR